MVGIGATFQRHRHYLDDVELVSAGAMVAAYMGEPALAHQLELMRARVTPVERDR